MTTPADLNGDIPSKVNNYGNLNLPKMLPEDINKIAQFNEWMQTQSSEYSQRGGDGNYFFPLVDGRNFTLLELKLALLYLEHTICPARNLKMFVLFKRVNFTEEHANTYLVNIGNNLGLRVQVCLFNPPVTNTHKVYAKQVIPGTTFIDIDRSLGAGELFLKFNMPLETWENQLSTNIEEFALQVLDYNNIPTASYYVIDNVPPNNFIKETITREVEPEINKENVSNLIVTNPDINAFKCYTHHWDSLINTRCYNPSLDSLKQFQRVPVYYHVPDISQIKYNVPQPITDDSTQTYLEMEADYKIKRYDEIMYCKSRITNQGQGVVFNGNYYRTVYRGMNSRFELDAAVGQYLIRNFLSTSVDINVATRFATENVPAGSRYLYVLEVMDGCPYIEYNDDPYVSYYSTDESEILFNRWCYLELTGPSLDWLPPNNYQGIQYIHARLHYAAPAQITFEQGKLIDTTITKIGRLTQLDNVITTPINNPSHDTIQRVLRIM